MSPGMRREDSKEKREGEERVLVDGCQACKSKRGIDGKQAPPPFPLQNFRRFQSFLKLVFLKKNTKCKDLDTILNKIQI